MATNRLKPRPLYLDLMELALVEADEPQQHFHFPLFRSATTRVSSRKHKQAREVAVVVKTYDMRGRLGLIEDELQGATAAYQSGDNSLLMAHLALVIERARGALAAVDTEMPTSPEKPA
jgi:hypothetical protein